MYHEIEIILLEASDQDPEANIWAQEGCEWGVEKVSEWETS
jgi:hypothetical protein